MSKHDPYVMLQHAKNALSWYMNKFAYCASEPDRKILVQLEECLEEMQDPVMDPVWPDEDEFVEEGPIQCCNGYDCWCNPKKEVVGSNATLRVGEALTGTCVAVTGGQGGGAGWESSSFSSQGQQEELDAEYIRDTKAILERQLAYYNQLLKQMECNHDHLGFISGGYYVQCADCYAKWVAIKPTGSDTDLDHNCSIPKDFNGRVNPNIEEKK